MLDNSDAEARQIAGEIVASYVSNNQMPPEQVPDFVREVMRALNGGRAAPAEAERPAVPVRRSVGEDAVLCLECGGAHKTLKRHIQTARALRERVPGEVATAPEPPVGGAVLLQGARIDGQEDRPRPARPRAP